MRLDRTASARLVLLTEFTASGERIHPLLGGLGVEGRGEVVPNRTQSKPIKLKTTKAR